MRGSLPDDSDGGLARAHARGLLNALGVAGDPQPLGHHPALAWRCAGLMEVTGRADGPGLVAPVALTAAADGALAALRAIAPAARLPTNGASLLGERARLLGLSRGGRVSANGSCRLIAAQGGGFALNLARADDWDLVPALLGGEAADWPAIERLAAAQSRDALVAQGRLLGLAIAADEALDAPAAPFVVERFGPGRAISDTPLVVDLSALWAGPLAGSLLAAAGARVVKVESLNRPDGARGGDARFFDLMNAGKSSVAFDFGDAGGRARLRALVAAADIVIEGSRPRALAHLGIEAAAIAGAGATWVSITAYGRAGDAADLVGFGDDAAVAGGLSAAMARRWGEPLFAGDAIADPLTGITAALAAWAGWRRGGGRLISVALAPTVAHALRLFEADAEAVRHWQALAQTDDRALYPLRAPMAPARALGADNQELDALIRA